MNSRKYSDARVMRLGAITLVVMALIMAAAFNLGKFPGFSGRITLPAGLGDLPGVKQLMDELNHLDFRSSAPRCNGAAAR